MDNLMGMANQFLNKDQQQQGGAHLNNPPAEGPDLRQAAQHANDESGDAGDLSLFESAMARISGSKHDDDDIDEDAAVSAHREAYDRGNAGSMDSSAIGAAAAMQALKMFTGGGQQAPPANTSGGQSKLIGLAMSEACKLFAKQGGSASGNKEDAVSSAGQMIMKMLVKQQMNSMMGGGNSGGMGGLLSLATKLM